MHHNIDSFDIMPWTPTVFHPLPLILEALSKHLAVEWGQYGVRLVCVAPGPIGDTVGYSKLGK